MKELIFSSCNYSHITYMIDEAEISNRLGIDVTFVLCNSSIGRCSANFNSNSFTCKACVRYAKKILSKCTPGIKIVEIDSYSTPQLVSEIDLLHFKYNSIEEIKAITYKGAKIGNGCLSTYISATRNNNPLIDSDFRLFFDKLLREGCYIAELQRLAITNINPDRISLFNGRTMDTRSALDFALNDDVELRSCEHVKVFPEYFMKRYFLNSLPHGMANNVKMINELWADKTVSMQEKETLGKWFFESKTKQKFAGDTNYIKGQKANSLPQQWNLSKRNFVIFNSSEDEFTSIGDEYDKGKLFNTQIEGIKHIASVMLAVPEVQIYLRVHPNLKDIKYKYHTDLMNLSKEYKNLIVIPALSDVSSYSLMENAERIIVFGSTMGVEAAYAGKPVINLCRYFYSELDVTYDPQTIKDLDNLLLQRELKGNNIVGALKFGYYYMNPKMPSYSFFDYNYENIKILGRNLQIYPLATIFGSSILYGLIIRLLSSFFKNDVIPIEEE